MLRVALLQFAGDDEKVNEAREILCFAGTKKMLDMYGDQAFSIIKTCYEVSPGFFVQLLMSVYGTWWSSGMVSDYHKSVVTLSALVVSSKEKQLRVLVNTFIATGGTSRKFFG
jgi:hypothetical protein